MEMDDSDEELDDEDQTRVVSTSTIELEEMIEGESNPTEGQTGFKGKIDSLLNKFKKSSSATEEHSSETVSSVPLKDRLTGQLPGLATILAKFSKKGQETRTELEVNDDEIDEEKNKNKSPRKKIKLTPIHIIILVALGAFAFLPDEEPAVEAPKKPPVKAEKKIIKPKAKPQVAVDSQVTEEPTTIEEQPEVPTEKVDETVAQVEEFIDTEDLISEEEDPSVYKPVQEVKKEMGMVDEIPNPINDTDIEVSDDSSMGQDFEGDSVSNDIAVNDFGGADNDLSEKLTKQVLSKMEEDFKVEVEDEVDDVVPSAPESPPVYDIPGRALVYNCKDLHWACIDIDEYKACKKNYSWNNFKKIPTECYPLDTYENERSCAVVQQSKTDSAKEIDFCKN